MTYKSDEYLVIHKKQLFLSEWYAATRLHISVDIEKVGSVQLRSNGCMSDEYFTSYFYMKCS